MTKNNNALALRRLMFEADDLSMLFYRHRGRNKFFYSCVWGEYVSYSVFVGTWEGCPPGEPVFTRMTEYRFGEDEGNAWQKMADKLEAEAQAAGAACWDEVTGQRWWTGEGNE